MLVDPTLSFSAHCEAQVGKANRILGMIRRAYTYIDRYSMVKLYTVLVRPRLEHGYPPGHHSSKSTAISSRMFKDGPLIWSPH